MSMFTMQFSEEKMLESMGQQLFPDEHIKAAVYCNFQDTGFFASPYHIMIGYVGLTDRYRIVGNKSGYIITDPLDIDLNAITKLKVKKMLFGQYQVYMEYFADRHRKLKFSVVPKIGGTKFPNQKPNMEFLIQTLKERQAMLR